MAALLVAMIVAMLPVPVYIMLILWIDRYEAEPLWMLATAFFWGATVAVFAAYFLNTFTAIAVAIATESMLAARLLGAIIIAPFFEELAKGLILFILFWWKKDEFDGVVDGFVYASMVGLGFAMTENFQYYGKVISQGGLLSSDFQEIYFVRGGLAAYSHPLFTSMTGIGLGIARQVKNGFLKFIMPLIGLGLAMFLHFLWNFSASFAGSIEGFLAVYAVLMVPIFLITLGIVFFALLREGRVVREYLLPDLHRGFFTQEDYNRLITIRGRLGSSLRAFRSGGIGVWRARMQYNQAASELAFHRSRVARGVVRMDHEMAAREQAIVQLLMELRQRLGQHY
jgi:RsiW-degrading membrane proteinase PrsW (M82 family)